MDRPPAEYLYINLLPHWSICSDASLGEVIPLDVHSIWTVFMIFQIVVSKGGCRLRQAPNRAAPSRVTSLAPRKHLARAQLHTQRGGSSSDSMLPPILLPKAFAARVSGHYWRRCCINCPPSEDRSPGERNCFMLSFTIVIVNKLTLSSHVVNHLVLSEQKGRAVDSINLGLVSSKVLMQDCQLENTGPGNPTPLER
jgi:hypothetical protein